MNKLSWHNQSLIHFQLQDWTVVDLQSQPSQPIKPRVVTYMRKVENHSQAPKMSANLNMKHSLQIKSKVDKIVDSITKLMHTHKRSWLLAIIFCGYVLSVCKS